ncbi:MAG: hypothetical protein KGZ81_08015 [Flavobacteriales bacterium]|nr:hypothetical protein [Flavobacteriales bacterium]
MNKHYPIYLSLVGLLSLLTSCNYFGKKDYVAYFGGEIINPTSPYVLFMQNEEILDTLYLDKNNRFFKKFDSLVPGMYSFKHEPEYQYVYFDQNDSLMVRLNTQDFDESVVFCGKGEDKNNFLMELYLKNESDRQKMFEVYDYEPKQFQQYIDSIFLVKKEFFEDKKSKLNWSEGFDLYARTALYFSHYIKKEIYPLAHNVRTGHNLFKELPASYFSHRNNIDYNAKDLMYYSPFMQYLNHMMSAIAFEKTQSIANKGEQLLQIGLHKLSIADTIFTSQKSKNKIFTHIAYSYLLEDQDVKNNTAFIDAFKSKSKDPEVLNEITNIGNHIHNLQIGNKIPVNELQTLSLDTISSVDVFKRKSVVFFWTSKAESHRYSVHKKVVDFQTKYPHYDFIAINIDKDMEDWQAAIKDLNYGKIKQFRAVNFEVLKEKWVLLKLQRSMILNENGVIVQPFVNLFAVDFENHLK